MPRAAGRVFIGMLSLVACAADPPKHEQTGKAPAPLAAAPASEVARVVKGNLTTELVPDVPKETQARLESYLNVRRADLAGWDAAGAGLFVLTRLANVTQLHRVDAPLGMRRQLTFDGEGVDAFVASPGPRGGGVLVADEGGNENTQLYLMDAHGGRRLLSDGKSRSESPVWADDGSRIAYSSTQRNSRDFDIWTLDTTAADAKPALAYEVSGLWTTLDWSPRGDRLLVLHEISETRGELVVIEPGRGVVERIEPERAASPSPPTGAPPTPSTEVAYAGGVFAPGGAGVYYLSDHGGEFRALWYRDRGTGRSEQLSPELHWDFERVVASPDRRLLALTLNEAGWSKLMLYDTTTRRFLEPPSLPRAIIQRLDFSPDGRRLALTLEGGRAVGDVYVLDLARDRLERWTESEVGGLDPNRFHEPRAIQYESFDGREIPALVYEPEGAGPHPVLISIHGGPEGQSRPFFSAINEYLVSELGISVILPNVRGSTGYGRGYCLLDNAERRQDSVKDIGALLDWIAREPHFDARHVGVYGGSYGGYMSLASGAMFGSRIAAVVDMVGISNFVTFLESTKEYRRDLRRVEYGDERLPEMRQFLERISPLRDSEKIVAPLFVAQGKNDPRVPLSEAEQIVKKVRGDGREVWFMLAADEGHGFQKKVNRDAFLAATTLFYERHLLGRAP